MIWMILFVIAAWAISILIPVYFMYCFIPHKSIKEGFRDWINDGYDDF